MQTEEFARQLRERAAAIVKEGHEVRQRLRDLTATALAGAAASKERSLEVMRAVLAGARDALETATAPERTTAWRAVIDGMADAVSVTAEAARLALAEARAKGRRFAEEDLSEITHSIGILADALVDQAGQAFHSTKQEAAKELAELREHAKRTVECIRPGLTATLEAAREQSAQLGREAVQAGTTFVRSGAGQLFTSLGGWLQKAGEKITPPGHS